MFLRATKRFKDGKALFYWSLVENVRVGRRVFQRQALYLGELNDSQQAEWQKAVEAFDEDGHPQQLKLFPEDRAPTTDNGSVVRIRMDRLSVKNLRNWGEVWLGTVLNDEGTYLLRTNLPECDPKTLWKRYMIQDEIEYAFRELKNDIGLRPVYHQLDDRIEAHIFTSFMALCLFQTLRAIAREHAPGLTP